MSVTVSFIRSPSPVTVTVYAVFQFVVLNVRDAGAARAALFPLLETDITTMQVGCWLRPMPYVPLLSSVIFSVLRLKTISREPNTMRALLVIAALPECPTANAHTRRVTLLDRAPV